MAAPSSYGKSFVALALMLDAQRKGKSRKASRLRKRSDKLSDKVRDVACKINSRGKKVCKKGRKRRSSGFNTHHPTKRRNRY